MMPVPRLPVRSVRWLLAELSVVVVGILLAISIDAWWQDIEDRETERDLLQSLAGEFERNQARLQEQFATYRLRSESAEALLALGPNVAGVDRSVLNAHWRWVIRGGTYDPSTGVLDAAVASGSIRVIQDHELRAALADWPGGIEDFTKVEVIVEKLIFEQMVPWMRQQTALPNAWSEFGIPDAPTPTDFELLASSTVTQNFLREIIAWGRVLEESKEKLEQRNSGIRARIAKDLRD